MRRHRLIIGAMLNVMGTYLNAAGCDIMGLQTVSLGNGVSSYDVFSSTQASSINPAGLSCTALPLLLLSTGNYYIKATVTSANGFLLKKTPATNEVIPYVAAASSNNDYIFTGTNSIDYIEKNIATMGNRYSNLPMYFRTSPGANVAAGSYSDILTIRWQWKVCTVLGFLGLCLGTDSDNKTTTLKINLNVANDCQLKVPTVNFVPAAFPASFSAVTNNIEVNCTKGLTYYIGIDQGDYASGGRRQLSKDSSNFLQYDIFSLPSNTLWTDTISGQVSGTGTGTSDLNTHPFSTRIYPVQTLKPAGIYRDQVRINIYY